MSWSLTLLGFHHTHHVKLAFAAEDCVAERMVHRLDALMSVEENPKIEDGEGAGRSPTSVLALETAAVQIMEPLPPAPSPRSPRCTVTRVQEYTPTVRGQLRELLSEFHDLLVTLGVPSDANHSLDKEIAELHSKFAMFLVATRAVPGAACGAAGGGIEVFGCIALMDLGGGVCEMKRLFVRPCGRRTGAGVALCEALLEAAAFDGDSLMKLGTLERLSGACDLYERLGFTACGPYRVHRLTEPDTRYYERATALLATGPSSEAGR
jgi:GNAT superfamily N-acetyltransferase